MIDYNFDKSNSYTQKHGSMMISGIGIIKAEPDNAIANIGTVTENVSLDKAQKENAAITNSIINGLLQEGIPQNLIKTASFNIEALYDYVDSKQVFRGYRVSNILSVTITAISKVGEIIDGATANGANQVNNISFSVSNPSVYYKRALNLAIKDAIEKVKAIAGTLPIKVEIVPYKIVEVNNTVGIQENPMQKLSLAATPILPGQISITAEVNTSFMYYSIP